ncbi:hypothetical protein M0R45_015698 [Rubus argutus]|uniref:Uncharacterized protein n=1 Tax=Rubus argutus TaxID=59490 RepID=A0AAW1XRA8_RUBAR
MVRWRTQTETVSGWIVIEGGAVLCRRRCKGSWDQLGSDVVGSVVGYGVVQRWCCFVDCSCKASSLLQPLSNVATSRTPVRSATPITATALSGSCAHHHNTQPIHLGNHFNLIQSSPYLQFTIAIQQAIKQLTQPAISLPTINQVHNQIPKLRYTSLSRYVSTI